MNDTAEYRKWAADAMPRGTTPTAARERLARACMNGIAPGSVDDWDDLDEEKRDWYRAGVDAILTELEQPSEAMIEAMMRGFSLQEPPHVAMRDALVNLCHFIRNED